MDKPTPALKRGGRRRQTQARCDTILNAARELMAERGYVAMTMDDLAARAGITKPTLYRYFDSKETIAVQAVVRLMQNGRNHLTALDADLPAIQRIEHMVRWVLYARYVEGHATFGVSRDALNPIIRANPEYQAEAHHIVALFTQLIEQAKQEGHIPHHTLTRIAAQTVFSILRDWEYDELIQSGQWTAQQVADCLSYVVLGGLRGNNEVEVLPPAKQ